MKILITGAEGMVGQNLIASAISSSNSLLTPTLNELDLRNYSNTLNYLKKTKPDFIIHLASYVGGIAENLVHPFRFYWDNLAINNNLLFSAAETGVIKLLNLASACVYPVNKEKLKEDNLMTGKLETERESYALAKLNSILCCRYLNTEFQTYYKTLVPCNLYGPHDHFFNKNPHFIPAIIRRIHEAKTTHQSKITIWGDGTARRELMYVGDLVNFILFAIDHFDRLSDLTNVGSGRDETMQIYYENVAKIIGVIPQFQHDLTKPIGVKKRLLDISKCSALGWKTKTSLETGLQKTYDYFIKKIDEVTHE